MGKRTIPAVTIHFCDWCGKEHRMNETEGFRGAFTATTSHLATHYEGFTTVSSVTEDLCDSCGMFAIQTLQSAKTERGRLGVR